MGNSCVNILLDNDWYWILSSFVNDFLKRLIHFKIFNYSSNVAGANQRPNTICMLKSFNDLFPKTIRSYEKYFVKYILFSSSS